MADLIELKNFYNHVPHQSPEDHNTGMGHFNIVKIEDLYINAQRRSSGYSRRSFFKISLVIGKSIIHYADRSFAVDGATLVFTNPMVPYQWETLSEEQSGYICIFTEQFFSRFGNIKEMPAFQSAANAIVPLANDEEIFFIGLFKRMLDNLESDYAYKYDLLRNQLMECIHEAQKMQPAVGNAHNTATAAERITALFAELLERQFPLELENQSILLKSPSEFATHLNVHVNHLNKALKQITGKTTSQHISARMLLEARTLLKMTDRNINEIAWALGFDEPNHFSSFFKTLTKISPLKYRQSPTD